MGHMSDDRNKRFRRDEPAGKPDVLIADESFDNGDPQ